MQLKGKTAVSPNDPILSLTECDSKKSYLAWYAGKTLLYASNAQPSYWTVNLDMVFSNYANVVGNYMTHTFTPFGSSTPTVLSARDVKPRSPGIFGPEDEYTDTITWSLPSTKPGTYKMQIVVHGPSKDSDNYLCLQGETAYTP